MAETGPGFWYVIFWALDQKLNEIPLPFCDNLQVLKLAESMTRSEQSQSEIDIPLVRAAFANTGTDIEYSLCVVEVGQLQHAFIQTDGSLFDNRESFQPRLGIRHDVSPLNCVSIFFPTLS